MALLIISIQSDFHSYTRNIKTIVKFLTLIPACPLLLTLEQLTMMHVKMPVPRHVEKFPHWNILFYLENS